MVDSDNSCPTIIISKDDEWTVLHAHGQEITRSKDASSVLQYALDNYYAFYDSSPTKEKDDSPRYTNHALDYNTE